MTLPDPTTDRAQPGPTGPVLVTGAAGFVGRHLVRHLLAAGDGPLVGVWRPGTGRPELPAEVELVELDLNDAGATRQLLARLRPGCVYHLAAQSSVEASHADPNGTLANNIGGQVNLFEAARALAEPPRLLVVGSSEEYGLVSPDELPIRETNELRPLTPYAVSKVAQDLLGFQYFHAHRLPVVRVRPFTHTGPGQEPQFATPAFARQIARIEAGLQEPVLLVGNLDPERDISDVRDIIRGYRLALLAGQPGQVYNLGSGRAVSIRSVLDGLLALSTAAVRVEVDPGRLRPVEMPTQYCDTSRLRRQSGWQPRIPLAQTLADVLADWRARVAHLGAAC